MHEVIRDLIDLQRRVALLESLERRRPIGARVYNSGNISINDATVTALTFDSERYDTDSLHSTSVNTDRLTASISGYYLISGAILYAPSAVGIRETAIQVDGTTIIAALDQVPGTGSLGAVLSTIYYLAAASYVQLLAYQTSGGALNITALSAFSPEFMMHLLDPV